MVSFMLGDLLLNIKLSQNVVTSDNNFVSSHDLQVRNLGRAQMYVLMQQQLVLLKDQFKMVHSHG